MEKTFTRYAVYWRPDPGPLADFGAAWLGWDAATGTRPAHPDLGVDAADLTAAPRKYGLHGTIKPPMYLADGKTPDALFTAFTDLCAALAPVTLQGLQLSRLGGFLALTPRGDQTALATLASRFVRDLDAFRAAPSPAELERRRARNLSARQEQYLSDFGYPYVMDEFRFHVTLTGQMPTDQADAVSALLQPHVAPLIEGPFHVTSMMLLGQDEDGMFHDIHRAELSG